MDSADNTTPQSLLRLSACDRRGLGWVEQWARGQLTARKRARKYRAHEPVIDAEEVDVLQALVDLERAGGRVLEMEIVEEP